MTRAFVALGSNLNQPLLQIQRAIEALGNIAQTKFVQVSSLYQTPPVGYDAQPDFINAVAELNTFQTPKNLMQILLAIESSFGRERSFANAPRVLDLDLLWMENTQLNTPFLTLPHPRMQSRGFVLFPLAEIAPDLSLPPFGSVVELAKECEKQGIRKLA